MLTVGQLPKTRSLTLLLLLVAADDFCIRPLAAQTASVAPTVLTNSVDATPQRYNLQARASQIDPRAKEHPEIDFVFTGKEGKIEDMQHACVDTRVASEGRLVVWLMGHNQQLFDRVSGYGLHAIQVHYANKWFSKLCQPKPASDKARGDVRLEACIGQDVSDQLAIPTADCMMERTRQFLIWLEREHPQGAWQQFLSKDRSQVLWDKVIMAGSSHGATTAARFAKHQSVDRVVMLCGPRDQDQDWQAIPSATPANRYFGFSHVLDGGWTGNHYCRSWELLGLNHYGPIVDIDSQSPPYENSRRLISQADVAGDRNRAHSAVQPGKASPQDAQGKFLYEPVWRYLFTHPADQVGNPSPIDPDCVVQP